jgi:hypothetical protein
MNCNLLVNDAIYGLVYGLGCMLFFRVPSLPIITNLDLDHIFHMGNVVIVTAW